VEEVSVGGGRLGRAVWKEVRGRLWGSDEG
jgi:hypothetical protein